ncbi:MAG: hypothetical protein ACLR7Z_12870 [Bilophila wadsworthia]
MHWRGYSGTTASFRRRACRRQPLGRGDKDMDIVEQHLHIS